MAHLVNDLATGPQDIGGLGSYGPTSWVDKDLSAYISSDAVGVFGFFTYSGGCSTVGVRKKGSTDTLQFACSAGTDIHFSVGVDSNGVAQFQSNCTSSDFYIIGYYTSYEAVFYTNYVSVAISDQGNWEDQLAHADAIAAVLWMNEQYSMDFRPDGSTNTALNETPDRGGTILVGCTSGSFEFRGDTNTEEFHISGYLTDNAYFRTNRVQQATGDSTFNQLDGLEGGNGSVAGVYIVSGVANTPMHHRAKNGAYEYDTDTTSNEVATVIAPSDGVYVEGKYASGMDVYYVGTLTDGTEKGAMIGADF